MPVLEVLLLKPSGDITISPCLLTTIRCTPGPELWPKLSSHCPFSRHAANLRSSNLNIWDTWRSSRQVTPNSLSSQTPCYYQEVAFPARPRSPWTTDKPESVVLITTFSFYLWPNRPNSAPRDVRPSNTPTAGRHDPWPHLPQQWYAFGEAS